MKSPKLDFENKVSDFLKVLNIDFQGKKLCIALSGGADSVSLLMAIRSLSNKFGYELSACHFNHMIRGEEADRDENFCIELCNKIGVTLYRGRDDVPAFCAINKTSLEEGARICRYSYFDRLVKNRKIDFCATAHNMNDNAETLIFNLIRGTGLNGASGIAPLLDGIYLRPLLNISREEIEEYLNSIQQNYVTDSTNNSFEYSRNRIRNIIIPELKKINSSAIENISNFIGICREDKEVLDDISQKNSDSDLRNLPSALRKRIILRRFKDLSGNILNGQLLLEIENTLENEHRATISVNNNFEAVIYKGNVDFYKKSKDSVSKYNQQKLLKGENSIFDSQVNINITEEKFEYCENINKLYTIDALSFDNISGELKVRSRKTGDKILIHGVNKSLKKLFIDCKIPKEYRDLIPIIYDDKGIIYVPFVGISDRVFTKGFNKNIWIKTTFDNINIERWMKAYAK